MESNTKDPQELRDSITSFSDFFKLAGKNEQDYTVPENGTWAEKAAMQLKRLKVSEKVLNKGVKVRRADTTQWKHWPWFSIIEDTNALAGFRLAYFGYVYEFDFTNLGARPEYLDQDDATWMGETFTAEFEKLAQYQAMADEEED